MLTPELLSKIRQIEISTRHLVQDTFAGDYHSVFKGQGMEFDEVRLYSPGDEVRRIDWNVTARMGTPYVRRYHEERELTVMLVVDASGSGDFGSSGQFKRDLAAELTAVLSFAATTNNDRVGLLIFTDRVELLIPPRKGRRHVLRLIREMLVFQPQGAGHRRPARPRHDQPGAETQGHHLPGLGLPARHGELPPVAGDDKPAP